MRQALADGNNIAKTAYSVKGGLKNSRGTYTGMTLVAIDMIRTYLAASPETQEVVFAWDSSPTWRHDYYPEYKANRKIKRERPGRPEQEDYDFPAQKRLLQKSLAYFGIPQIEVDLMEADDIAGMWMKTTTHPITFISNDIDWMQVLQNPLHNIYRTLEKEFVGPDQFEKRAKGCKNADEFIRMYGIQGQSKDNIPGIAGVGPVTALKYLRGELPTKTAKQKETLAAIEAWVADPNGYDRSLTLTKLGAIPEKYARGVIHETPAQFDAQVVRDLMTEFEANARLAKFDEFIAPFEKLHQYRLERDNYVRDQEAPGADRPSDQ